MIKKLLGILASLIVLFCGIQTTFALQTYVGVKILNLSDDPASSCAGQYTVGVDPFQQGRIRAISSILPNYPIYYELKNASGTIIYSGNISDGDYTFNDTFYLPSPVDLSSGANYSLFLDIDAIRIYLPIPTYNTFTETADDNYWTAGYRRNLATQQYSYASTATLCSYGSIRTDFSTGWYNIFITNNRNQVMVGVVCGTNYCELNNYNLMGMSLTSQTPEDFRMDEKYAYLYQSNVGNIQLAFTFT